MLSGKPVLPMHVRLEPLIHILDQLPDDQLYDLFNVTGTSSKLGLLDFLNRTNITVNEADTKPSLMLVSSSTNIATWIGSKERASKRAS
ncbi:hypothetical protein PoB_000339700 [Plakobranchus ocellatus]|uniref:Uncharacterized protein n=1 Tax=Plakobranchus ocellatus TaxID=259542 RepID=A0AAV3Y2F3_9GAST|nr:hypothetical protein PoB_000339700 [Plakobranchus ocellatus]